MEANDLDAAIKHWNECVSLDPGGVLQHFWPLYYVYPTLQKQGLSGQALKERMWKCFKRLLIKWGEDGPQEKITPLDIHWLVDITCQVDIADLLCFSRLKWAIENDYNGFVERVKEITDLPAEEVAALLYDPPKLNFPPGHPLWLARGVEHVGQWRELKEKRVLNDAKNTLGILRAFAAAMKNAYEREGRSDNDKVMYISEHTGPGPSIESEIPYLDDANRLSQFFEIAGVDMSMLTEGELARILDLLNALDIGFDFSSKKGRPIEAYYGDKADSEKTQRNRLFRKIRESSDK